MLIALLPCFFIWVFAFRFLPQKYKTASLKMTIVCFFMSLGTVIALNLELEGGALSGVVAVLVFSLLWALVLALINLCLKLASIRKFKNKGGGRV